MNTHQPNQDGFHPRPTGSASQAADHAHGRPAAGAGIANVAPGNAKPGKYRWIICVLLLFGTIINYIDRQVIGILKPEIGTTLGWSEIDYANLVFAFQLAYAIGYLVAGPIMARVGVRLGYGVAVAVWSLAGMAHAIVRTAAGFMGARFVLGLAEGANFPAAIKAVSDWFPKKERALATGVFNAGANLGALITPIIVPLIAKWWGWQAAFLVTGAIGLVWLFAWVPLYREPGAHKRVSAAELAYIRQDPPDPPSLRVPWLQLLRHKQTWVFVTGMFMTAPVWWFYLFWVPDFLNKKHGLDLLQLGLPLFVIYLMTAVGSVGGGWLSSHLLRRGWSLNASRKIAMLTCAACALPVFAASQVTSLWVATVLIGLAASAHQGFAANLFTLVSDTAPRQAVSSIVGIGGLASGIGGMIAAKAAGYILEWTGSYMTLFAAASVAYCAALLIMHLLNPKHDPMRIDSKYLHSKT